MSGTNSPQRCIAECADRDYTYAGLQVIIVIIIIIIIILHDYRVFCSRLMASRTSHSHCQALQMSRRE